MKDVESSTYNQIRIVLKKQFHYEISVQNIVPNPTAKLSKKNTTICLWSFTMRDLNQLLKSKMEQKLLLQITLFQSVTLWMKI